MKIITWVKSFALKTEHEEACYTRSGRDDVVIGGICNAVTAGSQEESTVMLK